jgi:Fic family protein
MKWNWQNTDWPNFRYDTASLVLLEQKFLRSAGEVTGAFRHFNEDDSNQLRICC